MEINKIEIKLNLNLTSFSSESNQLMDEIGQIF